MQLVVQVLPGLHVPHQALQQRPATVGQHCHRQALPCVLTLETQSVPSTCNQTCMPPHLTSQHSMGYCCRDKMEIIVMTILIDVCCNVSAVCVWSDSAVLIVRWANEQGQPHAKPCTRQEQH